MAHFLYPLRPATRQEGDAFAFPKDQGIMKTHHDVWSVGIGAHLIAKCPFSVGDMLCLQNEEFVITERFKQQNKFVIKLIRDPRITMEATCEELDAHFYLCPGQEMPVNNADAKKLLGKTPPAEEGKEEKKGTKKIKESVDSQDKDLDDAIKGADEDESIGDPSHPRGFHGKLGGQDFIEKVSKAVTTDGLEMSQQRMDFLTDKVGVIFCVKDVDGKFETTAKYYTGAAELEKDWSEIVSSYKEAHV